MNAVLAGPTPALPVPSLLGGPAAAPPARTPARALVQALAQDAEGRDEPAPGWDVVERVSRQVWSLGLNRMVVARAGADERYLLDHRERLHRVLRVARPGDPWVLRRATALEAARLAEAWARGDVRLQCEQPDPQPAA